MSQELETLFVDRAIDEVNAFHRDERKAQIKEMRAFAKDHARDALHEIIQTGIVSDPYFIADKAREFARNYLEEQYTEDAVSRQGRRAIETR